MKNRYSPRIKCYGAKCTKCASPVEEGRGVSYQFRLREVYHQNEIGEIEIIQEEFLDEVPYSYEFCSACGWILVPSHNRHFVGWEGYLR